MRTRVLPLLLLSLLAAGFLSGCGGSSSSSSTDVAAAPTAPERATTQDPQLEAAAREADLKAREQELARREVEVVRHEREAIEPPAADPVESDRPPVRHYPRATEPVQEIVWVTIPASTTLSVELLDRASSETSAIGDRVRARLVDDVNTEGWEVFPAGSMLSGTVTDVVPSKKIGGKARLGLAFDRIELLSGGFVEIQASLVQEGKGQAGKDAATIGGAAAGGAILGHVIKDGKDQDKATAIGAVVGAAVGTAVAANNKTQPVTFEPGATVSLTLADAVRVSVDGTTPRG